MHISLDAALQRQPLLSTVGDKLLPTFPGAAAAYSLRALNGDANDAVRVRRDADNEERDFTAEGVALELEDWVNGKLETTLPADVATSAAAYSLRKVKSDYTGNAVQIRRASDNVEVDVAFDSNGEVSASSAISNVVESPDAGDTTATTLGEFLTEDVTVYQPDYTSDDGLDFPANITTEINQTAGGRDASLKISNVSTGSNEVHRGYKSFATPLARTDGVSVTFEMYRPSGSASQEKLGISFEYGGSGNSSGFLEVSQNDSWETFTVLLDGRESNGSRLYVQLSSSDGVGGNKFLFSGTTGDHIFIRNLKVEQINQGAKVVTWYDQSGNGYDATQDATASQPKIAEGGSLLADGIDFDGVDDSLVGPDIAGINDYSVFITAKANSAQSDGRLLSLNFSNNFSLIRNRSASNGYQTLSKSTAGDITQDLTASVTNKNLISLFLDEGTDMNSFINSSASSSNPAAFGTNDTLADAKQLVIGANRTASAGRYNGSIDEIVIYASDQSDNRFKIESNINNHYGIYNDANEFDSSETAYSFFGERGGGVSASSDFSAFTLDVQTASAFAGAKFSNDVASGDSIYISFNASLDEGANTASPFLALKDIDAGLQSTALSNVLAVTEGFNSGVLTSTSNSVNGFAFSEGDDNAILTISNIKVSRVSRDGFVETWYDQSGNGNDASQANMNYQPKIVANGSDLGELDFDGVDDLLAFPAPEVAASDKISAFMAATGPTIGPSTMLGSGNAYPIRRDGPNRIVSLTNSNTHRLDGTTFGFSNGNTRLVTLIRDLDAPSGLLVIDGNVDDTISTSYALANGYQIGAKLSGSNYIEFSDLKCNELIVYATNQTANRSAIESNIADEYGITLS